LNKLKLMLTKKPVS